MKFSTVCRLLCILLVLVSGTMFGQKYAVTSGNWDGGIWAASAGGDPGSVTAPTEADDIIITPGAKININTSLASCKNVTFQDSTGSFGLADGSILSVYGNFTIFGTGHNAFYNWAVGAKLRFAGSANQTLSGWSNTGNAADSTILMEIVVDKPQDTLKTPGTDMKLGLGRSLEIVHGVFFLGYRDDINGRDYSGATTPTIRVDTGGQFRMSGSLSAIRSGISGRAPIGLMTLSGSAYFLTTSSIGICLGGVDIENGGNLHMDSFSTSQPFNVTLNSINVKFGGTLWNSSTTSFWDSTSGANILNLDSGGVYKVTTLTTNFPRTVNNYGTVRYQRSASDGSQTIVDMDYYRLEISFAGNKTWTLTGDHTIADSLEVNNSATFIVTSSSSHTLTVGRMLRLTSGTLDNSNPNVVLTLGDGATISRATGVLSGVPAFLGTVNLKYTSTVSSVTTGPEVPTGGATLQDFQIITDSMTVTLASPVTVNGTLTLSNGTLDNNTQALILSDGVTIRRATATITSPPVFSGVVNIYYISSVASVTTGFELPSSPTALNNFTIICDTNTVVLSSPITINGTFTLSTGNLDNSSASITLIDGGYVRRATAVLSAPPVFSGSINLAYVSTLKSVTTGLELPNESTTLKTFSMESPMNITLGGDLFVRDTLRLVRGIVFLGDHSLTLSSGGVVEGIPADSNMIGTTGTGAFRKLVGALPETFVFPIGDTSGGKLYTPATLSLTTGTLGEHPAISARTVSTEHPANQNHTNYLRRYWPVSVEDMSGYTADVSFQYGLQDVVGNESLFQLLQWTGSEWVGNYPGADTNTHTLQATGVAAFATADFSGILKFPLYHLTLGWNLVSAPFTAANMTKSAIFPTAASDAFKFAGSYTKTDTLTPGVGYWVKFTSLSDVPMVGQAVSVETVTVSAGWNIIGSLGTKIAVANVMPLNTALRSSFYKYNGSYQAADSMSVGMGFWIKVSTAGKLILAPSAAQGVNTYRQQPIEHGGWDVIRFSDAHGVTQDLYLAGSDATAATVDLSLYELPPAPPAGADNSRMTGLDVRFASNHSLGLVEGAARTALPVALSASAYPVTATLIAGSTGTGRQIGLSLNGSVVPFEGHGSICIAEPVRSIGVDVLMAGPNIPESYSLDQNYPNPFNPSTSIRFGIPADGLVRLEVYNLLGQKVGTLLNEQMKAGFHTAEWNAAGEPSGVYFYRLTVRDQRGGAFSQIEKMVLMK